MPYPDPRAVADAISEALGDGALRERLGEAAVETASEYNWRVHMDALERFLAEVAAPRVSTPS
jgi:glycosyltransferase involved in cell wall biosynthesis